MLASSIITSVAKSLGDLDGITWPESTLVGYLNQAQRAVVMIRPDAHAVDEVITLVAGTKQGLDGVTGALRLLDITRNMGADGVTPGRPVRHVDRQVLDAFKSTWHSTAGATAVKNFAYDERNPTTFYVMPPVKSGETVTVEAVYAKSPAEVVDPEIDSIALSDIYEAPIIEFMLYRAYSDETDSPTSTQSAMAHQNSFLSLLGVKTRTDISFSPNGEVRVQGGVR